jgi:C1A family cysteine protease
MNYKNGIYKCDCTDYIGGHAVLVMGYSDTPKCHYHIRNSWGPAWGDKGYFKMFCDTCKIEGGSVCGDVKN